MKATFFFSKKKLNSITCESMNPLKSSALLPYVYRFLFSWDQELHIRSIVSLSKFHLMTFEEANKNADWWNWVACHLHYIHGSHQCPTNSKRWQQSVHWWYRKLIQAHSANLQRLTLSNCLFCDQRALEFLVDHVSSLPRLSRIVNMVEQAHQGLTLRLQNLLSIRGHKHRLQFRAGIPRTECSHFYWEKQDSWRRLAFHLDAVNQSDFSREFREIEVIANRIFHMMPEELTLSCNKKQERTSLGGTQRNCVSSHSFLQILMNTIILGTKKPSFDGCYLRVFVWLSGRSPSPTRAPL